MKFPYNLEKQQIKYPRIPHLPGSLGTEDDIRVSTMPPGPFYVFEKLDGANVGIMMNGFGELEFITRGSYIQSKRPHEQWGALKKWAYERYVDLHEFFKRNPHTILYGEWLWAIHSVSYDSLPDYFIAFDIYDINKGEFYPYDLTELEVTRSGISCLTPLLTCDDLNDQRLFEDLRTFQRGGYSTRGDVEGFIFRRVGNYSEVYKYVLPEFHAGIKEHWFNRRVENNELLD